MSGHWRFYFLDGGQWDAPEDACWEFDKDNDIQVISTEKKEQHAFIRLEGLKAAIWIDGEEEEVVG